METAQPVQEESARPVLASPPVQHGIDSPISIVPQRAISNNSFSQRMLATSPEPAASEAYTAGVATSDDAEREALIRAILTATQVCTCRCLFHVRVHECTHMIALHTRSCQEVQIAVSAQVYTRSCACGTLPADYVTTTPCSPLYVHSAASNGPLLRSLVLFVAVCAVLLVVSLLGCCPCCCCWYDRDISRPFVRPPHLVFLLPPPHLAPWIGVWCRYDLLTPLIPWMSFSQASSDTVLESMFALKRHFLACQPALSPHDERLVFLDQRFPLQRPGSRMKVLCWHEYVYGDWQGVPEHRFQPEDLILQREDLRLQLVVSIY